MGDVFARYAREAGFAPVVTVAGHVSARAATRIYRAGCAIDRSYALPAFVSISEPSALLYNFIK